MTLTSITFNVPAAEDDSKRWTNLGVIYEDNKDSNRDHVRPSAPLFLRDLVSATKLFFLRVNKGFQYQQMHSSNTTFFTPN